MRTGRRAATLTAVVVVLAMTALLGAQTWATHERGAIPQFWLLHAAPDGRIFILLGNSLYVESPTGESLEVIPLDRFGVRRFEGDFAVLSDNTIILKAGRIEGADPAEVPPGKPRQAAPGSPRSNPRARPLQRCDLNTGKCRQLSGEGKPFHAGSSFKLAVDEHHQRIRVADTEHHQLLLLDFDGRILRRQDKGFRFPSSMTRVAEEEFLVSDTLHARIVRISGRDDDFGQELSQLRVEGWSQRPGHTRPKGIAVTAEGARWVVVTDSDIRNGELYLLGNEATRGTPIALPEGTDTLYPEALADSVLLPDDGLHRIHRFANDGSRMEDLGSPELKARLGELASRAARAGFIFNGSSIGMLAMLPMLLMALWLHRKAAERETEALKAGAAAPPAEGGEQFQNPETRLRHLRGEYLFQRRYTVLDSRDARFAGLLMGLLLLLMAALPIMLMAVMMATVPSPGRIGGGLAWPLSLLAVTPILLAALVFQAQRYERLAIDARGIRYASFLSGPLALLERLFPSWEVAWQELEHVTLKPVAGGRLGMTWYYEVQDRSGRKRRISALSWRLAGEDETGLTMRGAVRLNAAEIQAVIRKTWLFRALSPHIRD